MQNPHMLLVLAACMLVVPLYAHAQEVSLSEQIRSDDRYFGFSDKLLHLIDENAMYEHNFMIVPHRLGDDSGTIKLTAETIASLLINHYNVNATVVSHPVFGYVAEAAIPASVLPDILQHRFVGVIIAKEPAHVDDPDASIAQRIKDNPKFDRQFAYFMDAIENDMIDVMDVVIHIGEQHFTTGITYNSKNMELLLDVLKAIPGDRIGYIPPLDKVAKSNTLHIVLPVDELPNIARHDFVKLISTGLIYDGFGLHYLNDDRTKGVAKLYTASYLYDIPYEMTTGEISHFGKHGFSIMTEDSGSITLQYPRELVDKLDLYGGEIKREHYGRGVGDLEHLESTSCGYKKIRISFEAGGSRFDLSHGEEFQSETVRNDGREKPEEFHKDRFVIDANGKGLEVVTRQLGTICSMEFVPEDKKLEIVTKSFGRERYPFEVTIPYTLLGDEFVVTHNGENVGVSGTKNTISNTIRFTPHLEPGVENTIEITGNKLFPPPYVLPTESGQTIKIRNTGDELKYVMDGGSIQSVETFYDSINSREEYGTFMLINMTATESGSLTITLPQEVIKPHAFLYNKFRLTVDGIRAIEDKIISPDAITLQIPFLRGAEHITIQGASMNRDNGELWANNDPRKCFWSGSCPTKALGVEFTETNQVLITDSKNDDRCTGSLCIVPNGIKVDVGDTIQWSMNAEKCIPVVDNKLGIKHRICKKAIGDSQRSTFAFTFNEPGLHFYIARDRDRHAHGFIMVQDKINITEKPQADSLVISDIRTVNSAGEGVSVLEQNQMVHIAAEIRSRDGTELPFVYQIAPANSAASSIAGTIAANRTASAALSWIPDTPGNHTVLVYAGEDRDSLTQRGSVSVRIGDTGGYIPPEDALPEWVKNNAGFFTKGNNSDDAKKAIDSIISYIAQDAKSDVPEWVKDAADWWVAGRISDQEFIKVIEYLAELEKLG